MKTREHFMHYLRMALVISIVIMMMLTSFGTSFEAYAKPNLLIHFDGHMHTTRSDGSGSVANIMTMALARGLDFVIITDHCKDITLEEWTSLKSETAAASDGRFLALPSYKITGSDGVFNRAHMLAWNIADPIVGDDSLELCP
jgi:hypothetical protein